MDWAETLKDFGTIAALALCYIVILLAAKALKDFLTPYHLIEELAKKDNPAIGITLGGYFLGVSFIFVGVVSGPSVSLQQDIFEVLGYSLLGLVFLNISRWCLDKVVFSKFCNITAIVEDQNCGMAAVRCGVYVATGLIAGGSLHGEGGGVLTAVAFFVLGQVTLLLFTRVYDWLTPYHLQIEVEKGNLAAGIGFGGTLAAVGLIIGRSTFGSFAGWTENLILFGELAISGAILLFAARFLVDKLILTGHDLNAEISGDQNVAAGFLEMFCSIGFAIVLVALI